MSLYSDTSALLTMFYRMWLPFTTQNSGTASSIIISRQNTWKTGLPMHGRLRLYVPYAGATGVSYDGMVLCQSTDGTHVQETYFGGVARLCFGLVQARVLCCGCW